ncbi:MAG TPA: phosphodiester glycosidase family protein [Bacteroidia bacterium]|jgi:uncharacterized protein YigE (DUF2233 family)|nr:phosphodiester glycosidase family protein [Bacteroidia bacterium]
MKIKSITIFKISSVFIFLLAFLCSAFTIQSNLSEAEKIIDFIADPDTHQIQFYLKNDNGEFLKNLNTLRLHVESKQQKLIFAMNGGMYKKDNSPQGLYIENHTTLSPLDTTHGKGNFYMQPNGVLYITDENKAMVCSTTDFRIVKNIKYATQSGPMLLHNGEVNTAFKQGSSNLNIRNGAGILPDGRILFAMSKKEINFYDFAMYFKNRGCRNALYLDGFVSRTYLPQKNWIQTDGDFGVMIGVTEASK